MKARRAVVIAAIALCALAPALMGPSGSPPGVKPAITCTTLCNATGLKIGQSVIITKGTLTGRASTTTNTCDPDLHVQLPNLNAQYTLRAWLRFDGNGATANGWKVRPISAAGVASPTWYAVTHANTTSADAAPQANHDGMGGTGFTRAFNAAGAQQIVIFEGETSASSGTAPELCIQWSQNASNVTATDLNVDSYLVMTRIT